MTPRKCYDCIYRETLPGDIHSACRHPLTAAVHADSFSKMLALFGKRVGVSFVPAASHVAEELGIAAVPQGVARGWFLWPVSFDPVWLVDCLGFTLKPEQPVHPPRDLDVVDAEPEGSPYVRDRDRSQA